MHGSRRGTMLVSVAWFAVLAGLASSAAGAPPPVADFVRRPMYDVLAMSPDGKYLAATMPRPEGRVAVVLRREDLSVSTLVRVGPDSSVYGLQWANSRRLFLRSVDPDLFERFGVTNARIHAIEADGSRKAELAGYVADWLPEDEDHVLLSACDGAKCRDRIAYKADVHRFKRQHAPVDLPSEYADVMADAQGNIRLAWGFDRSGMQQVHRRDGKSWTLVHDESRAGHPLWPLRFAGDGSLYAQVPARSTPDHIARIDLSSGRHTPLLRHERVDPSEPIWSDDGRTLVGAWFFDGRPEALFVDPRAPEAQALAALAAALPDTHARPLQVAKGTGLALVGTVGDRDPGRYYLFDTRTRRLQFLLAARPWLDGVPLLETRSARVEARDGTRLNVLLTLPEGRGPFPLVVLQNNTFRASNQWGFDGVAQALGSRGIATIRVDARGTFGYGLAFRKLSARQWGRAIQDDFTDATRWAIAQGHADAARVCIAGDGYGAYVALMGVVREPDLYRCAAAADGFYDLQALSESMARNETPTESAARERELGTDPAELERYSPIHHAEQLSLPLLITHRGWAQRDVLKQFNALSKALKTAGHPFETMSDDEMAYGVYSERFAIAHAERLVAFLERHLRADREDAAEVASGTP